LFNFFLLCIGVFNLIFIVLITFFFLEPFIKVLFFFSFYPSIQVNCVFCFLSFILVLIILIFFVNIYILFNLTLKIKICCCLLIYFSFDFNPHYFNYYFSVGFVFLFFFSNHPSTFHFLWIELHDFFMYSTFSLMTRITSLKNLTGVDIFFLFLFSFLISSFDIVFFFKMTVVILNIFLYRIIQTS
jgi:hypothetical protein